MGGARAEVAAREVRGEGFHRSLETSVRVVMTEKMPKMTAPATDPAPGACAVALVERLPREVYVDFDEVADQRRLRVKDVPELVAIGFEGGMDVERPAEVSEPFAVASIATNVSAKSAALEVDIVLPVHFRYQAPARVPFAPARLVPPDSVWFACEGLQGTNTDSSASPSSAVPFTYKARGLAWREAVVVDGAGVHDVVVDIPVGSLEDAALVHGATALVTMLGALFLVYTTWVARGKVGGSPKQD